MKYILKQILVPAASAIAGGLIVLGPIKLSSGLQSNSKERQRASIYKSTFNRTFSLPEHVDQNKMYITLEKGKIFLKFSTLKA